MCHAREQLGDLLPPGTPPLPSFPARHPARSGPYLPALRLPGRPARCGRQGEWAGGPAGGRWTVRYPAPDMAHRLGRHSRPGGQGRKERQPRAPGRWARWREIPAVPTFPVRCATQGTVLPCSSLGRALLRAPAGWRRGAPPSVPLSPLPLTPTGTVGAAAPPTHAPPGPAAVTLAAPAQRLPSACPAPAQRPAACSATPGGWEGPLHPSSFSPLTRCCRTLTGAAAEVQGDPSHTCNAGLGRALKA